MISGALMSAAERRPQCTCNMPTLLGIQLSYSVSALAMALIGGTAHWIGPVLGAILLGSTQQFCRDHLLGSQRAGARHHAGAVRGRCAQGHLGLRPRIVCAREASTTTAAPDAPLLQVGTLTKTFGGFTALDNISVDIRKGERFGLIGPNGSGQDHADQLHFRRAASADRQRGVLRRGHHPTAAASRAPRHRPQLPDSAAVQEHDGAGKPHGRARLCHRRFEPAGGRRRDVDPDADGPCAKAGAPTDTLSQVELRKMELRARWRCAPNF